MDSGWFVFLPLGKPRVLWIDVVALGRLDGRRQQEEELSPDKMLLLVRSECAGC